MCLPWDILCHSGYKIEWMDLGRTAIWNRHYIWNSFLISSAYIENTVFQVAGYFFATGLAFQPVVAYRHRFSLSKWYILIKGESVWYFLEIIVVLDNCTYSEFNCEGKCQWVWPIVSAIRKINFVSFAIQLWNQYVNLRAFLTGTAGGFTVEYLGTF